LKKIIVVGIILAFFATLYLISMGYTVIIAQGTGQCPGGEAPVYEAGKQKIDNTTGMPVCIKTGELDPLGNIFGK
jgi:hypothetical protein